MKQIFKLSHLAQLILKPTEFLKGSVREDLEQDDPETPVCPICLEEDCVCEPLPSE